MLAIANAPVCPIKSDPDTWAEAPNRSHLEDELLFGMPAEITGEEKNGWVPVRTFYGYTGWAPLSGLVTGPKAETWQAMPQKIVRYKNSADVLAEPRVQAERLAALPLGARVAVQGQPQDGWQAICLPDGRRGYAAAAVLGTLYTASCEASADRLRDALAAAARCYLGTQYRWGGKTPDGIDCSGLCSMAYLLCGIKIWRDAALKEGYPIHRIHISDMRKGDLVYFPGHIAMYLGDGQYIHSTARVGDGGVTVNSFYSDSPLYRPDLPAQITAVGSFFAVEEAT